MFSPPNKKNVFYKSGIIEYPVVTNEGLNKVNVLANYSVLNWVH